MTDQVALNASPTRLLSSLRGEIVAARIAYPEVLHVEIHDPNGGLWRLATQDAEFTPSDPERLLGATVESVELDPITIELRLSFAQNTGLVINPAPEAAEDDPPTWELISPDGLALEFGPGIRWQIAPADAAVARA